MISVVLVDDHKLLRNGLGSFIQNTEDFEVLFEADNGKIFQEMIRETSVPKPNVVLMDINMPVQDGYVTTKWLTQYHPQIKVLALSMHDDEVCIIRMLRCGAKGYLLKDADPEDLLKAIREVHSTGFYQSALMTKHLPNVLSADPRFLNLSNREMEVLRLLATDLTYKEIAEEMNLGFKTVEGYRERLSDKLAIKTRVGLVMYAIKAGIIQI